MTCLKGTDMNYLGIDYGDMRTGLAISHGGIIASAYKTVEGDYLPKVLKEIVKVINEEKIDVAVLGLPKNMDGTEGFRAHKTHAFADELAKEFDGEIAFCDERLTTVSATRIFNETDTKSKKRKGAVDKLAATIILQTYLDSQAR